MKKIIIIFILSFYICTSNNVLAEDNIIDPIIINAYESFTKNTERKFNINKQLDLYLKLDLILDGAFKKSSLSSKKRKIISDLELLNTEKIKKIKITKILIENAKQKLKEKQAQIINEEKLKNKLEQESNSEIINKYSILKNFKYISYNKDNIFLENGIWYYYNYSEYKFFKELENIKVSDFEQNGISINNSLVIVSKKNNNIGFTDNYKKVKLISDNIIYGISDKYIFLQEIKDDKEFLINETDNYFKELKNKTLSLTNSLTNEDKIKIIYEYVLENHEYSKIINLSDKKIFSGIELYKNGSGVCEAYVKLFMYMLSFAGINDINIIRGYVIDAEDFPQIGHAWLQIGNKYYDPTFDDPVGLEKTKTFEEYKYFGLPKDLFYTNRFDYDFLPEDLKTKSLEYRKDLIKKNLSELYDKYKGKNYILLKETEFKNKYNISYNENIAISNFDKILPLYEVKNYTFTKNNTEVKISNVSILTINNQKLNDENLNLILEYLDYNLDGYYFFKWYNNDGTFEYRLCYDLK